jgi:light-regulated signal transduction histidine kinase (bacteriophytochrome)
MTAIQPCALLLLIGPDWQIETVSANAGMLGDHKPSALIGQPLADLIGSKAIHTLRNRLSWLSSGESEVHDFGVEWGGVTLDIRASRDEDHYLVEAELAVEPRLPDGIGMVRSMSDRLTGGDPAKMAEQAMRQLVALTGFDRLMMCGRGGEVIASAGRDQGAPFVMKSCNVPKIVADREAEAVPLLGNTDSPILARAGFLAGETDRLELLERHGIAAAMSLPLRIDGEPVGTVHAFHPAPRRCSAERRSVAHLFAERLAARMARHGWAP